MHVENFCITTLEVSLLEIYSFKILVLARNMFFETTNLMI